MNLIEFREFLHLYAWELLVTFVSLIFVCGGFTLWIEDRNEQITKNWKGALDANS